MAKNAPPSKQEIAFIESIDACFPFRDETAARSSIRDGAQISDNAALMIACELVAAQRVDRRGVIHPSVPKRLRLKYLKLLAEERPTPLVMAAVPVAEALIAATSPSAATANALLAACRVGPPCFNALNLLAQCSPE